MRGKQQPSAKWDACRGATLIDLMVTVTILGILTAVAVRIGDSDELEIDAAARTIASDMLTAQALAIETRVPIGLWLDTTQQRGWFVLGNGSTPAAAETPLRARTDLTSAEVDRLLAARAGSDNGFGSTQLVSANFGGGPQVTFGVDGTPTTGGLVQLGRRGLWLRVRVQDGTGRIRITGP